MPVFKNQGVSCQTPVSASEEEGFKQRLSILTQNYWGSFPFK